ncbi:MAG TPA: peptidylprolyl isomerase [Myxococcota bacterium]|jgi:cyclophilin family peptidyl-prolyl cis-trans isomerase/HEAT repeat protein
MPKRLASSIALLLVAVTAPLALGGGACQKSAQKRAESAAGDPMVLIAQQEQERAAPDAFAAWLGPKEQDAAVRKRATLAVARLEVLAALPLLQQSLADADASVRAEAAFGLGQLDLAIDPKTSAHQVVRNRAEKALVDALASERDASVRSAIVRALGRVADSGGLDALIAIAKAPGLEQAQAFQAVGVAGKRRAASRSTDTTLDHAALGALEHGDDATRTAAAYAVFQQKLPLDAESLAAGMDHTDPQTRIFLVRAAAGQQELLQRELIARGLRDSDWRVQVEALRAAQTRPQTFEPIAAVLDAATTALVGNKSAGAQAHVVRTACEAIAASGAGPAQAKPALEKALVTLARTSDHRGEACACAVALDTVDTSANSVERCNVDASDADIDRMKVEVLADARTSSTEKVQALLKSLKSDDVKTRMLASDALVAIPTRAAAEAAAARLSDEDDFGVATTLIEGPLSDDENADLLSDGTLYKIVERFKKGTSFEQVQPLVTVARLVRGRQTPSARAVLAELQGHSEPRVRDAANNIAPGDRGPGPRASVVAAPAIADLPLFATVKTTRGNIQIAFDRENAPATVANFVALAKAKFYDGTPFHRVIADFVAQGGDKRGDGAGGPGYTIACENSDETYSRGSVGMATSGKDTGGSQFFFTHSSQPHLDGRYTLFAHVTTGLDVMDALQPNDKITSVDLFGAAPTR